jgi:hypothetical protein
MIAEGRDFGLRAAAFRLRPLSLQLRETLAGRALKSAVRRLGPKSEHASPKPYFFTSLISPIKLFSESRKNVIHKS